MHKVTMSATIPVAQYANLQPTIEAEHDDYDTAMNIALQRMQDVWDRTAEKPLRVKELDNTPKLQGEPLRCWASGTRVNYEPINHVYDSGDGKRWLSGSAFASRYKSEFQAGIIAKKMADKHDVDPAHILDMWELNRDASSTVGTSVHLALQLRGQYKDLSKKVKDGSLESALTKNPILRPIVEAFFETRDEEDARYEVFVADPARAHCGLIDRLVIEGDGVWIEDFKTSYELDKPESIGAPFKGVVPGTKLGGFWLQLAFYQRILQTHGKTVKGLRVHNWIVTEDDEGNMMGEWVTHEHAPIDLDAAFKT